MPRRKKKNKLASSLTGGILFLSVISLVSVGFSTWTIGSNAANATFNIGADDVDGTNKYFFFNETLGTIDDPSITNPTVPFEYNDYGIIDNGVVTNQGKFAFFMAVLLRGENGIYKNNETLTEFSFKYLVTCSGAPLLDYLSSVSFNVRDRKTKDNSSYNGTISSDKKVITLAYNGDCLTKTADYLFYKVELSFDFPTATDFKATIADKMSSTNLSFEVLFGDEVV